jgi:hypothetical protein
MSALLTPALTTMNWNIDGIVRAAVRLILAAIERKPYRRRTVQPPHLRKRSSTGPPESARSPGWTPARDRSDGAGRHGKPAGDGH